MNILALDLGTRTGWAMSAGAGMPILSGVQSFATGRFDGGGMRYLRFQRWLDEIGPHTISEIAFEEVRRHAGTDAAQVYGGLMATLTAWAELHHLPYQGIPVGTIKRHATGRGNANKDAMMAAMQALGHAPCDHNEADALALLHLVMEQRTHDAGRA